MNWYIKQLFKNSFNPNNLYIPLPFLLLFPSPQPNDQLQVSLRLHIDPLRADEYKAESNVTTQWAQELKPYFKKVHPQ